MPAAVSNPDSIRAPGRWPEPIRPCQTAVAHCSRVARNARDWPDSMRPSHASPLIRQHSVGVAGCDGERQGARDTQNGAVAPLAELRFFRGSPKDIAR